MADPGHVSLWRAAQARGLLPADAPATPPDDGRPWPVVLLVALGAWLAAVPLLGVASLLIGPILENPAGPYIVGVLCLGGAVTVLRGQGVATFFEQLAIVGLAVGGGSLAAGFFRHLPDALAAAVMAAVALGVAFALPRAWIRVLLGAAAAGLAFFALVPERLLGLGTHAAWMTTWLAAHGVLAIGIGAVALADRGGFGTRRLPWVDATGAGWIVTSFALLAFWSGMTFLVAGAFGGGLVGEIAREGAGRGATLVVVAMQGGSVAFALAALLLAGRASPQTRSAPAYAAGVVVVALAWFMPALGGTLAALAWCVLSRRWRLAGLAAFTAVWILGAFYYQLRWELATKAAVLVAAGTLLAGAAAWAQGRLRVPAAAAGSRKGALLVALAALATLGVANVAIWQKEDIIARGQKVFVRLAPVDPRSLMQGDFMRLNYAVPWGNDLRMPLTGAARPYMVARLDAGGVAQPLRVAADRGAVAPGEIAFELTPKDGRWILVSDAWFFAEGTAQRWEAARYGEFRVTPDGRALLVGLADEQLRTIQP